jgi:high-affinity nickel-transport protein
MDTLVHAVALGFVLGLQHATDPDHLVAVATIVTRERRFRAGALIGAFWGLGHTLTLVAAGGLVLAFRRAVPAPLETGLELVVAAMLVALGTIRLRDAFRGLASADRLLADHDHDGREVVHRHEPGRASGHPHVHPSRRLLGALGGASGRARAILIGAVHGMAGTAAVALLVLTAVPTPVGAAVYLGVFGLGTIVGMTALTAALAFPVSLALRMRRARRLLAAGAGAGSIALGVLYAVSAF